MPSITFLAAGSLLAFAAACAPARYQYPTLRSYSRSEQYMSGESRLVPGESLLEVLRRTRPTLLRLRGAIETSSSTPQGDVVGVYINGTFAGGFDVLQTIAARDVFTVRRRQGADVSSRFARGFVLDIQLVK